MRPVVVTLSATGKSQWIVVNELALAFGIGLAVAISSGATITYTVEHTFDETGPDGKIPCSISRTGTAATLTLANHMLSVGDSIQIDNAGDANLNGRYDVASVVDANNVTYTVSNTGATADTGNATVVPLRVYPHSVLAGQTARKDGNYAYPVSAIRLNATVTSGRATLTILQGMGR